MKRFIKNLFIRIFKRKQYRDSIEVMNELLGIEKPDIFVIFNFRWNKGNKYMSLTNYKNIWMKNGNKPEWKFSSNAAMEGYSCYDFHLFLGYNIFNYTNFNWKPKKQIHKRMR